MGMVSAIGLDIPQALESLRQCRSGIGPIKYLQTRHQGTLPAAEVKASDKELANMLGLNSVRSYSRTALLGIKAAREAYESAGLAGFPNLRTGIISATSVGGIDKSEVFFSDYLKDPYTGGDLRFMVSHDCGESTERIADDLKIHEYVTTISTACSSSANAMILGARLIKTGMLDCVIVGGADALTRYTLNGFNSLRIVDSAWCQPFDQNRNGLNLGEAAAYLVMESDKALQISGKEPLCELAGYGNANDAYHPTASSPDGAGALMAMELALKKSGLGPTQIDYINVHGTATLNNDLSEGQALKSLFKDYLPSFSSTKSYTGHTLAAAGSVEAVISVLALHHHLLIPNLNFKNPIEALEIQPVTALQESANIQRVLSNSFGFGGNCSSMIFSSC